MDIPTYLRGTYEVNQDYFEQQQQTLLEGVGPNGFQISQLTGAQITAETVSTFLPIQPAGTVFFNTDIPAWQGVLVAANPDPNDATVVTFITTGAAPFPWTVVTTNTNMANNMGFFVSTGGNLVMTLPATANVGDTIKVSSIGGTFTIAQRIGQSIIFGDDQTLVGVAGSLQSMMRGDMLELINYLSPTGWQVLDSVGNFTVT